MRTTGTSQVSDCTCHIRGPDGTVCAGEGGIIGTRVHQSVFVFTLPLFPSASCKGAVSVLCVLCCTLSRCLTYCIILCPRPSLLLLLYLHTPLILRCPDRADVCSNSCSYSISHPCACLINAVSKVHSCYQVLCGILLWWNHPLSTLFFILCR